jgi:hypothetical protein
MEIKINKMHCVYGENLNRQCSVSYMARLVRVLLKVLKNYNEKFSIAHIIKSLMSVLM